MFTKTRLWISGYWVGLIGCFSGFVIAARTDGFIGGLVILSGLAISGLMRLLGKRPATPDRAAKIKRDTQRLIQEN